MDEILSGIIAAMVTGASATAKDLASEALRDAYAALKSGIMAKLGRRGAVQAVEDDPDSDAARAALVEALTTRNLQSDSELGGLAEGVMRSAERDAVTAGPEASIEIDKVRGSVGAIVEHLRAAGRIRLGEVSADQGIARVSHLLAGSDIVGRAPGTLDDPRQDAGGSGKN